MSGDCYYCLKIVTIVWKLMEFVEIWCFCIWNEYIWKYIRQTISVQIELGVSKRPLPQSKCHAAVINNTLRKLILIQKAIQYFLFLKLSRIVFLKFKLNLFIWDTSILYVFYIYKWFYFVVFVELLRPIYCRNIKRSSVHTTHETVKA